MDLVDGVVPTADELVDLYASVGWGAYTRDADLLHRAVTGSVRVVTARENGRLIGLARAVGDGATILYVQDILVRPDHQRSGVGRALMTALLDPCSAIRQKVLITDTEPRQRAFYESLGFTEVHDLTDGELRAFVRFN